MSLYFENLVNEIIALIDFLDIKEDNTTNYIKDKNENSVENNSYSDISDEEKNLVSFDRKEFYDNDNVHSDIEYVDKEEINNKDNSDNIKEKDIINNNDNKNQIQLF